MKSFILILFIFFALQTLTKAEDISEFEIEGISIGDSLLDHFSKNEINEALTNPSYYKNKKFVEIFLNFTSSNFDYLQIAIQTKDKSYKIEKIMMLKDFSDQIENCKKFKKNLINESSEFLYKAERADGEKVALSDPTGNSFTYISTFYLPSGGFFNFTCTDYGKEMFDQNGWFDSFKVSIGSEKISKYLQSGDAY
tara:strand:+ start:5356 stop:5943 length:588 start_codon:yes stop_codon:yes gene_type:complete